MHGSGAYGLWPLVIINSLIFVLFALSFTRPRPARDWRSFGAFAAFLVALFTEMYGFPLTIYLLSGWLATRVPGADLLSYDSGHLWNTLLGFRGDPHLAPPHIARNLIIFGGFQLLAASWRVLYRAQRSGVLARTGSYARMMFMYTRLARREEREIRAAFPAEYARYASRTPAFVPRWRRRTEGEASGVEGVGERG